jgi:hypothetical protein
MSKKSLLLAFLLCQLPTLASAQIVADITATPPLPMDPGPVRFTITGSTVACAPNAAHLEVEPPEGKKRGTIRIYLGGCDELQRGRETFAVETELAQVSEGWYVIQAIDTTESSHRPIEHAVVGSSELEVLPYDPIDTIVALSSCADLPSLPRNPSFCSGDVPPGNKPRFPCTLEKDLLHALKGEATEWNWWGHLDADFDPSWQSGNYGSNNLPVLAAAINLYTGRAGFDSVKWWTEFLTCQTGASGCLYTNDVKWRGGHEIMSPIYDAPVVTSVAAVHYWGATRNNATIRELAKTYLKQTWALYTLAAGSGSARTFTYDKFTRTSTTCPYTYSRTVATVNCDLSGNGQLLYNGPFIAMSGARSSSAGSPCGSDSDPLLVRAIAWPNVTKTRESAEQYDVLDWLECQWNDSAQGGINVYGNDSARRQFLRNHVSGASNDASTLVQIIGTAKFIRPYHFLKWAGGERMTLLTDNPNTCPTATTPQCTAALYGTIYYPASQNARMLYPWPGHPRKEITRGYGKLIPSIRPYTTAEAGNIDPADGDVPRCEHGTTTVTMPLPTASPLFEVVVDQAGARRLY